MFVQNAEEHTHGADRAGPRLRGVAELVDPRVDHGPRGLPGRAPDRVPGVRRPGGGGGPMSIAILPLDRHRYAPARCTAGSRIPRPRSGRWAGCRSTTSARTSRRSPPTPGRTPGSGSSTTSRRSSSRPTTRRRSLLAACPRCAPGDLGMHLLVAPPTGAPVHGLTSAVMRATVAFCFDELLAAPGRRRARRAQRADRGEERRGRVPRAARDRPAGQARLVGGVHAGRTSRRPPSTAGSRR